MLKKLSVTLCLLFLAACAPSRQEVAQLAASQCPSVGINPLSPDYSQKLSKLQIDDYYSCMLSKTQSTGGVKIGAPGSPARNIFNGKDEVSEKLQLRLQYQYALWGRVLGREISPSKAQQEWLGWSTQVDLQEQATSAANRQTAAAMAAASNTNQNRNVHCTGMNMGGGMATINCN